MSAKLPSLSGTGRAWLTLALVLLIVGSGCGSWMLAACGLAVLAALLSLYLRFLPAAVLVWRRYLELVWWVPRPEGPEGLICHRPFALHVTLKNLGPLPLGRAELRLFSSRCVALVQPGPPLPLPPRSEAAARLELVALSAGQWFVHGAAVRLSDGSGLFTIEAYFPSVLPLKVLPRHGLRTALPPLRQSVGALDERLGVHTLRHLGLGGELRELRDYAPGDPFKLIAWKASARAPLGRLLVRDLDRETLITHYLLLDIGAAMREGPPGGSKLDHGIELCAHSARAVLDGGDSVGLVTFDGAVYGHLRPGCGPVARLRLIEHLLQVSQVVEEPFCGASDSEVCAAVARYLRQQEGVDARVVRPPPIDDVAAWARLSVSPGGEMYDLSRLVQAARRLLSGRPEPPPRDESPQETLRRFCRARGIELPYRRHADGHARRAEGLAQALSQVAAGRGSRRILLISDLSGVDAGLPALHGAVALCRRHGHELMCLYPAAGRYLPREWAGEPRAARAAEIFGWEIQRREAEARAALSRLGFHVLSVGPDDSLAQILGRSAARPIRANLTHGKIHA